MSNIDLLPLVPELFQLILINFLLLYALFFSGIGVTHQKNHCKLDTTLATFKFAKSSKDLSIHQKFLQKDKFTTSDNLSYSLLELPVKTEAFLPTPLQIVEPLSWLIVLSLLFSLSLYLNNCINNAILLTNSFICDDFSTFFKVLLCIVAAAAIALTIPAFKSDLSSEQLGFTNYEFLLLINLAILGMLCLISSYNFLTLYLSIELQSLSFYLLACMRSRSEFSAEAGLKYFILGAFSSAILLFGITLIYGQIITYAARSLKQSSLARPESV